MFARGFTKAVERLIVTAGKRIQADFSNSVVASRMLFQTFSRDSSTSVGAVPNGTPPATSTSAQFAVYNKFDISSGNVGRLRINATEVALDSDVVTPGSAHIPLAFYAGGSLRFQLDQSNNRFVADFTNATVASRLLFQSSTANGSTSIGAVPNGTSPYAGFTAFTSSNPDQSALVQLAATNAEMQITSGRTGAASYLPMTFYVNAAKRFEIFTNGDIAHYNNLGTLNASFVHRAADASASNNRAFYLSLQNESAVNVASVTQYVATDGSSLIDFYVTPAGSRASDRRFLAWRINPNGLLLDNNQSMPLLSARRTVSQTSGSTLLFDTVDRQQGGSNFNTGTGVYTAPVAGVYTMSFSCQLYNSTGVAITRSFALNVAGYASTYLSQSAANLDYMGCSQTRTLYLVAGATVRVDVSTGLTTSAYVTDASLDIALIH